MTSLPEADASGGEIFFKWFNISKNDYCNQTLVLNYH